MAGKVKNLMERKKRFYARVVVPQHLRPIVGKHELQKPLGADRRTAIRDLPRAVAGFHDILAAAQRKLASGDRPAPRPLSDASMAQLHYDEELAADERARNAPAEEDGSMADFNQWAAPARATVLRRVAAGRATDEEIAAVVGWAIWQARQRGYTAVEAGTPEWRKLGRTLASVELEALARSLERDRGDFAGTPKLEILTEPVADELKTEPVPLRKLFDSYAAELARSGRGRDIKRRWNPAIDNLIKFVKHDDAARLTRSDLIRWKDKLLETYAPKTVQAAQLGALRTILQYGYDNELLQSNVAAGIKLRIAPKPRNREKGLTNAEAQGVLAAAQQYAPKMTPNPQTNETPTRTNAKRWIPWLLAFTGARVVELCQLRKQDIREEGGIAFLRITPDAGSVKTYEFRDVPLHPQLIELGFLDFVKAQPDGPLFFNRKNKKLDPLNAARETSNRLTIWVRGLGIIGPDVSPHHGWRHRFKTVSWDAGLSPRIVDAIQGHAPRTAGESYGDVSLKAKADAIAMLPHYELT